MLIARRIGADRFKRKQRVLRLVLGVNELKLCDAQGDLTEEARRVIDVSCKNGAGLIHLGMSDHLIGQFAEHIENIGASAAVSWINNTRICCGDGICGACTRSIGPQRIVHLCKEQLDIHEYRKC